MRNDKRNPDIVPEGWTLGFDKAYHKMRSRDARYDLRQVLTRYFGSNASYYRYRYGDCPLSPRQQQYVEQLFRQYGYIGEVFDGETKE